MNDVQTPHTVSHQIARGEDDITLAELLGMVWEGRWIILVATVLVTSVGIAYALLAQPIYQADALIHVESERSIMPGHDSLGLLQEPNLEAEIRLLRSRMVIDRVVNERNLAIRAEPVRFPAIGGYIARRPLEKGKLRAPMFGLPLFAWGGEHIEVARLVVPEWWHGKRLTLVALDDGRFQLSGPEGRARHGGEVGELYASEDGSVQVLIREIVARPGTRFNVVRRASEDAVRDLQRGVRITDAGRGSGGVLRLSLEGSSPVDVQATLNAITNAYVRQNVERRSQEADQRIAFLDEQLPQIRRQLESAEDRLSHYRRENEALDLSAEGLALLEQTVGVDERVVEVSLKRSELSRNYGSQHPRMVALNQQEQQLHDRRSGLDIRIQGLPASQQELVRLQREVEVTTALYTAMLNQAQELRVVRAGTVGNVRIVDDAITHTQPVKPQRTLITLLSVMLGSMIGLCSVVARTVLGNVITDPSELERRFGLSCYATIPQSPALERLDSASIRKRNPRPILARDLLEDNAAEGLRSLRTSLHFALMNQARRAIAITGPRPGVGKTFLSVNLAYTLAQAGTRVLVVDADLRRGRMHEYFRKVRGVGLSDVLAGLADWRSCVQDLNDVSLDFLGAGTISPNPSELLMSGRFDALLTEWESNYDFVVLDTAPVLAATDGVLVCSKAAAIFMLLRSGSHTEREVQQAIKRLHHSGFSISGFVMNGVSKNAIATKYGNNHFDTNDSPAGGLVMCAIGPALSKS